MKRRPVAGIGERRNWKRHGAAYRGCSGAGAAGLWWSSWPTDYAEQGFISPRGRLAVHLRSPRPACGAARTAPMLRLAGSRGSSGAMRHSRAAPGHPQSAARCRRPRCRRCACPPGLGLSCLLCSRWWPGAWERAHPAPVASIPEWPGSRQLYAVCPSPDGCKEGSRCRQAAEAAHAAGGCALCSRSFSLSPGPRALFADPGDGPDERSVPPRYPAAW